MLKQSTTHDWEWYGLAPIKVGMTGGWLIYGIVLPT
jgi:hypothetical protein